MATSILVTEIQKRIDELTRTINELTLKRSALMELVTDRSTFIPPETPNPHEPPPLYGSFEAQPNKAALRGPKEAVLALVKEQPGRTVTEIANALEHQVASAARDKRNVLRTTIAVMVNEGALQKAEGKIYPKEGPM